MCLLSAVTQSCVKSIRERSLEGWLSVGTGSFELLRIGSRVLVALTHISATRVAKYIYILLWPELEFIDQRVK